MGSAMMMTLLGALLAADAQAGMTVDGKPRVVFHAEGSPGFLTFDGKTSELTVEDDGTTLSFIVPMDTVETGLSLRDQHMRDNYVETAKYPNVVLKVAKADVSWPDSGKSKGEVKASFTAHGVDKPVTVTYTIKRSGEGYQVKASFPFDTQAHGMEIPVYAGVTIKPAMTADVDVDLVDAE